MSRFVPRTMLLLTTLSCSQGAGDESDVNSTAEPQTWSVRNLGPVINSPYHDGFATISADGLVLYFASDRASYGDTDATLAPWRESLDDFDIYVSRRPSLRAPWGEPRRLPSHINTQGEDHSVTLSPDGHWLYFSSNQLPGCGNLDIFRVYREDPTDDLGWGQPENLGCEVNSAADDVCVIYHADEERAETSLFFVSNRPGGLGSMDIYESRYDPDAGRFGAPTPVAALNTEVADGHLDPEGGFIWTTREGGYGGSDIWATLRGPTGEWQAPVNVGPSLNTEFEEQMPSPFDHGRVLYFPSDRPGGQGGLDLYVAERSGTQ